MKEARYSALFIKDIPSLLKRFPPKHEKIFGHHSTIEFMPKDISGIEIGKEHKIKIIGRAYNELGDGLLVENPKSKNKYPHITLSCSKDTPPLYSNELFEKATDAGTIEYFEDETVDAIEGYSDENNYITERVIFLDRDGTVIRDPEDERVDKEEKIELFPDSIDALKHLAENNFSVILITNQAGIAEGRINIEDFNRINSKVIEMLSPSGIKILKTYMCPHAPEDKCECRKPKPTMILEAIKEFNLDPKNLYMVGDRESDINAGINAGIKTILVKTANIPAVVHQANYTAHNLMDAVKYVIEN